MQLFGLLLLRWDKGGLKERSSCSAAVSAQRCSVDPSFPPWFKFGATTSSYQIEGAWNVSDKSESIWDVFTHNKPESIADNSTGDVACDSYHLWRRDVDMAAEMGLDFYRFSISWPRLMPKGFDNYVSEDGARYYNDLINGLLARDIEPVVILYHWEMPEILQQLDGWSNPRIADWFANYARVVFSLYGDRVKTWLTINEPVVMCEQFYDAGVVDPGNTGPYSAEFLCAKHVLLAHAKAWRVYDEEFKHLYHGKYTGQLVDLDNERPMSSSGRSVADDDDDHGKVSIVNQVVWYEPKLPEYTELTDMVMQYVNGRFFHPIYSEQGGWPAGLGEALTAANTSDTRLQLPPFTDSEKELIRGTFDFIAFNYYSSGVVRPARVGESPAADFFSGVPQLHAMADPPPTATYGYSQQLPIYPEGLRKILYWLKESYGDIEMIITENGYSSSGSDLNDSNRTDYIRNHLEQILLSMKVDHVRVTGYSYWSLMDSFEWVSGYITKFGLYEVNFSDPLRTRTSRSSAHYYKNVIKYRHLDICKL